jgi:hypothetical protein
MIQIFSPEPHSHPVSLIEQKLGLTDAAILVPFESVPHTKERFCFENVKNVIADRGGEIVYGWLVWQYRNIFVEAEHHVIWRKPTGELACVTPQTPPEKAITFILAPSATYDFDKGLVTNNIRIALVADSRLQEVFRAEEQKTEIINAARRSNPLTRELAAADVAKYDDLEFKKSAMLAEIVMSQFSGVPPTLSKKVGRNDPCPCGSGKKYKKCHGA